MNLQTASKKQSRSITFLPTWSASLGERLGILESGNIMQGESFFLPSHSVSIRGLRKQKRPKSSISPDDQSLHAADVYFRSLCTHFGVRFCLHFGFSRHGASGKYFFQASARFRLYFANAAANSCLRSASF